MAETIILNKFLTKEEKYKQLLPQIVSLVEGENDFIANLANIAAALKYNIGGFFWVGFYFQQESELVLGPFQGPVACTRIKLPKDDSADAMARAGVCATSFTEKRVIIVDDVNTFPGHIACSSESKSEIVLPIYKDDKTVGVLDVDSDFYRNFDQTDENYLEEICSLVSGLLKK